MLLGLIAVRLMLLADGGKTPSCLSADLYVQSSLGRDSGFDQHTTPKAATLCVTTGETGVSYALLAWVNGKKTHFYSPPLYSSPGDARDDYTLSATEENNIRWELGLTAATLAACVAGAPVSTRVCAILPHAPPELIAAVVAGAQLPRPERARAPSPGVTFPPGPSIPFAEGMTRPVPVSGERFEVPWNVRYKPGLVIVKCTISIEGTIADCQIIKSIDEAIDRAILEWLAQRRYTPVLFQGRPVRVSYVFNFRLHAR